MSEAYKRYLIKTNSMTGAVWVEKDGHFISWADSVASAKATIDTLTEVV